MNRYRSLKYPPVVFWELTDKCNHNCIHCFNYWRSNQNNNCYGCDMTVSEYLEYANKIVEQKPARVVFSGGEPLVVFERIKPAIELFVKNNIKLSFNTNVALMTDEIAEYLSERHIGLFISFPSCREDEFDRIVDTKGAFQKVMRSIQIAQNHHVWFAFNMVVSKVNLNSIFDTATFLKEEYGADHISITRVSTPINAKDKFDQYLLTKQDLNIFVEQCVRVNKELMIEVTAASPITPCSLETQESFDLFGLKGTCEAGKTSYVISSKGTVRACARDYKEYGNFLTEDFDVIWKRMEEWRDERFIPVECNDCKLRNNCHGGCRIDGVVRANCRNQLDDYSDLSKLPLPYTRATQDLPQWNQHTRFLVAKQIQYVEESFAIRVSSNGQYVYCTLKMVDFIQNNQSFSLDDFCQTFQINMNIAVSVLNQLFKNHILMSVDI